MGRSFLLHVDAGICDFKHAKEEGTGFAWLDRDGCIEPGDELYIMATGISNPSIVGKAIVDDFKDYKAPEEVPGYGKGVWNEEWLEKVFAEEKGRWLQLKDYVSASSDVPIGNGRFEGIRIRKQLSNTVELTEESRAVMERCFASPAEVAAAFRDYFAREYGYSYRAEA